MSIPKAITEMKQFRAEENLSADAAKSISIDSIR